MRRAQLLPSCVVDAAVQCPGENLGSFQAPGEGHTVTAIRCWSRAIPNHGVPNQSPPSPTWQGHWWGLQTLAKNSGKLLLSTAASAGSTCRQVEAGTWLLHTEVG